MAKTLKATLDPIVLTMPLLPLRWPTVCKSSECYHPMCQRWRENVARRCANCDEHILAYERFIEDRDPVTQRLKSQWHEVCPVRAA